MAITAGVISRHGSGEIRYGHAKRTQVWKVGETVKVGFVTLRITAKNADGSYTLTDRTGTKRYSFVPHLGLERIQ